MEMITILLIVILIIMMILFAIGLKFPQGRKDWPLDKKATASILLSIMVFVLLFILSYFASQHVDWPSNTVIFMYVVAIIFVILIISAILLPGGYSQEGDMRSER